MQKLNYKFLKYFLTIGIGIYLIFLSPTGYFTRKKLISKINQLEMETIKLQKENENLKKKIELLQSDYSYIAELARKLGYANKGEKIYRFTDLYSIQTNTNKTEQNFKPKTKINIFDAYMIISLILILILILVSFVF